VSTFKAGDPARKGVNISGTRGQPVLSSAAGQVVYSGNGLIGYGELIIIKHSERMLSAYAHNSKRLVNEGDAVTAGQHIAAMGTDDRKDVVLHFEIRVNGKPSDPLKYLSAQ
jgi:lipoprotein NlpD